MGGSQGKKFLETYQKLSARSSLTQSEDTRALNVLFCHYDKGHKGSLNSEEGKKFIRDLLKVTKLDKEVYKSPPKHRTKKQFFAETVATIFKEVDENNDGLWELSDFFKPKYDVFKSMLEGVINQILGEAWESDSDSLSDDTPLNIASSNDSVTHSLHSSTDSEKEINDHALILGRWKAKMLGLIVTLDFVNATDIIETLDATEFYGKYILEPSKKHLTYTLNKCDAKKEKSELIRTTYECLFKWEDPNKLLLTQCGDSLLQVDPSDRNHMISVRPKSFDDKDIKIIIFNRSKTTLSSSPDPTLYIKFVDALIVYATKKNIQNKLKEGDFEAVIAVIIKLKGKRSILAEKHGLNPKHLIVFRQNPTKDTKIEAANKTLVKYFTEIGVDLASIE